MAVLNQLGLLLKQNLLERRRRWFITILEVGWPVLLFILCVVVRDLRPPEPRNECKYKPRSMPSAGVFPFVKSYVCNLNAKPECLSGEGTFSSSETERLRALYDIEDVFLDDRNVFEVLSNDLAPLLGQVQQALDNPDVKELLDQNLTAAAFLNDANAVKDMLIKDYNLSPDLVDALLYSQLNISKAREYLLGLDKSLCKTDDGLARLETYIKLPESGNVTYEQIYNATCQFDPDSINELVEKVQQQINMTPLLSLARNVMSLLDRDSSIYVDDVERMINVLRNLSFFKELAGDLPNIQSFMDWMIDVLRFVKSAFIDEHSLLKPEIWGPIISNIGDLANRLDPILGNWTNNSQDWEDFKRGLYYLRNTIDWARDTIQRLPGLKFTIGDLYKDGGSTIIEHLNLTVDDSWYLVNVLSNSSIPLEKVLEYQYSLMSGDIGPNQSSSCELVKDIFRHLTFPPDVNMTHLNISLGRVQTALCKANFTAIEAELRAKFNVDYIIMEFAGYNNSTSGRKPVDFKAVIEAAWDLVSVISKLRGYFDKYGPLLERLSTVDFTKIFAPFHKAFETFDRNMTSNPSALLASGAFQNMFAALDNVLEGLPAWESGIKPQIVAQSLLRDLSNDAYKLAIVSSNLTKVVLNSTETAKMIKEVTSLGDDVAALVYRGLTSPENIRLMIENPEQLNTQLCADVLDTLQIADDKHKNDLYGDLCNTAFKTLPGLIPELDSLTNEIRTKINLVKRLFESSFNASDPAYDKYASLSGLVMASVQSNTMSADWHVFDFSNVPSLDMLKNMSNADQYQTILPYSIMSTIMEVIGNSLKTSEAWIDVESHIKMMDMFIDAFYHSMDMQDSLFTSQTTFGRMLDWFLRNGPKKLALTLNAVQDPTKVNALVMRVMERNVIALLDLDCDPGFIDWFYGAGALDHLPMDEFQKYACQPNMTQIVLAELYNTYTVPYQQVFNMTITPGGDIDWVALSLKMVNIPVRMIQSSNSIGQVMEQYNWNAWTQIFNMTPSTGQSNSFWITQLAAVGPNLLNSLDASLSNMTQWRIMERIITIMDTFLVDETNRYESISKNGITLATIFNNSTKIRDYLIRNIKVSPAMLDALFNTLVDPIKVFTEIFTGNFTNREFCRDIKVSQFVDFGDENTTKLVDDVFCNNDWEGLLQELQSNPTSSHMSRAIAELTVGLKYNNLSDINVNYTAFGLHIADYIEAMQMSSQPAGPIFPELMKYNNMSMEIIQSKKAWEKLITKDPSYWPQLFDKVVGLLKDTSQLNSIGEQARQVYMAIAYQVRQNSLQYSMAVQQLRALLKAAQENGGIISLKDFVLPGELKKALIALDSSPEMTDTLLYSLTLLMERPDKVLLMIQQPEVFDSMCSNISVYKTFFSLPANTQYTLEDMQLAMCSFRVNVTVLLQEVYQDIDGLNEFVNLFNVLGNSSFFLENVFTNLYNLSYEQQTIIALLPNVTKDFAKPRWIRQDLWLDVGARVSNYTMDFYQSISQADKVTSMLYGVAPLVDRTINSGNEDTKRMYAFMEALLDVESAALTKYASLNFSDEKVVDGLKSLEGVHFTWQLLPDLMESAILTLFDAQKLAGFQDKLINRPFNQSAMDVFCKQTDELDQFLVRPAGNKATLKFLADAICLPSSNISWLVDELKQLSDPNLVEKLERILDRSQPPPDFSLTHTLELSNSIYKLINPLIQHFNSTTLDLARRLVSRWERVLPSIDQKLLQLQSMFASPSSYSSMLAGILNSLSASFPPLPELKPIRAAFNTLNAVGKMLLNKLQLVNQTKISIESFTQGYPETTKALSLLNSSSDIVEVLLVSASSSVKLYSLLNMEPSRALAHICADDLSTYFDLGPNSTVNLTKIQESFCSVNWTVVYSEIIENLELEKIVNQTQNDGQVNWTEFFSTVSSLMELFNDVAITKPVLVDYPWLNETLWRNVMERVGEQISLKSDGFNYYVQSSLASLMRIAPIFDMLLVNKTDVKTVLYDVMMNIKSLEKAFQGISGANFDVSSLFNGTTEIKKLANLLDELPGYVDISLQTLLQPEKFAPLLKVLMSNDSLNEFCAIPDLTQYVVYDNSTDLSKLQAIFCSNSINFTALPQELSLVYGLQNGAASMTPEEKSNSYSSSEMLLATSSLISELDSMLSKNLSNSMMTLPRWAQPQIWNNIFSKFTNALGISQQFDAIRLSRILQQFGLQFTSSGTRLPQVHLADAVMDVIIKKLEALNTTEVNLTSVLQNSPETSKALDLLQYLPKIVEIIIGTSRSNKFSDLMALGDPANALMAVCTDPNKYLTVPQGSMTDITVIMNVFCNVNWTVVAAEVMSDVNFQNIMSQLNNTDVNDWKATLKRVDRISELFQYLITNPPQFMLDSRWTWLNESVWTDILQQLSRPTDVLNLAETVQMVTGVLFKSVFPMFDNNPEFRKFATVLDQLVSVLKEDLTLINQPGVNFTIADLFVNDPGLGQYVQTAVELSPSMYALLLSISIKNPGELQTLIQSDKRQELLCNKANNPFGIDNWVDVPTGVNKTAVEEFLCSKNASVLLDDIKAKFDVPAIMASLQNNSTANWTRVQQNVLEIVNVISQMIKQAPNIISPIKPEDFANIADSILKSIDWSDSMFYYNVTDSVLRGMVSIFGSGALAPAIEIRHIVLEYVNELISRIAVTDGGMSINLADLFANATLLTEYLQATLNLDQETAFKMIFSTVTRSNKIFDIVSQLQQGQSDFFCDVQQFSELFDIAPTTNVKDLSDSLCNIFKGNQSQVFVNELSGSLQIGPLVAKISDGLNSTYFNMSYMRDSYRLQLELNKKIASFFNVTEVEFNGVDLKKVFSNLANETAFQSYLLSLTQSLPTFDVKSIGSLLNQLTPMLKTTEWWVKAEQYFKVMAIAAEVGANRSSELVGANLTLSTLLRDSEVTRSLLRNSFALAPDIIESLFTMTIVISPSDVMNITSVPVFQQLICSTASFPSSVNVTAVKKVICDTDFTTVLDELLREFDLDLVIQKVGMASPLSNVTSDFDWVSLLTNTELIANNLILLSQLQPPPIADFFLYDGNVTQWLDRLNKALIAGSSQEAQLRRLASTLASMEQFMKGYPEYKQILITTQVIQNYLDLALGELDRFSGEITLNTILRNKTNLIEIVKSSFDAAPEVIDLLLTQSMAVEQFIKILISGGDDPCKLDLSTLFINASLGDIQSLRNLFCSINLTALVDEIRREVNMTFFVLPTTNINPNATTLDWARFLERFNKINQVVEEMIKTPPTISPGILSLVNVTEYMKLLEKVQQSWQSQTFQLDGATFKAMMAGLTPLLSSSETGKEVSKYLNAAEIVLKKLNRILEAFRSDGVNIDSLFGGASDVKDFLKTAMNLSAPAINALLQSPLQGDAMLLLLQGKGEQVCMMSTEQIFIVSSPSHLDELKQIRDLLCSINVTLFSQQLADEFDIPSIIQTFSVNVSAPVQWDALYNEAQKYLSLLQGLNGTIVDQALMDIFNFSTYQPILQSLMETDPINILKLINTFGPSLQVAAGSDWPIIQQIFTQYRTGLLSFNKLFNDLVASGLTADDILRNSTALTELMRRTSDMSIDAMSSSFFDMYKDSITNLLKRSEIQEIVCNQTMLSAIMPDLPSYIDLKSVMCGVSDSSWVDRMKAKGYSSFELLNFERAIVNWYAEGLSDGLYDYEYIYSYRVNYQSNFTFGSMQQPLTELVMMLEKFILLPEQALTGFNMSYWGPILQNFLTAYRDNTPERLLKTLQTIEPLLRDQDFWRQVKQALEISSQYLDQVNTHLEALDKQGVNISITQLLPDQKQVISLLEKVLSPDGIAEFMALAFQPSQLMSALQSDDALSIFCNFNSFNQTFAFKQGINITAIQISLCHAAENNSLIITEVWSLLNLQYYSRAMLTSGSSPATVSPFEKVIGQLDRLTKNAEVVVRLMQLFTGRNNTVMNELVNYVQAISRSVSAMNDPSENTIGGMCDALVNLIDGVPQFVEFRPNLVRAQIINSITADIASSLDGIDELICELPSLNISSIMMKLADSELTTIMDRISLVTNQAYLQTAPFQCSRLVSDAMTTNERFSHTIESIISGKDFSKCLQKLGSSNWTVLQDVNTFVGLLNWLQELLASDVLTGLKGLDAVKPMLTEILSNIASQVQGGRLDSLVNSTAIEGLLQTVFNGTSIMVDDLLTSVFDVDNLKALLNQTTENARAFVCDPQNLSQLIPLTKLDVDQLSATLCNGTFRLNEILQALQDNLNKARFDLLANTKDWDAFISNIVDNINVLMDQFGRLSVLPGLIGKLNSMTMVDIRKAIPDIKLLAETDVTVDLFIDSVQNILDLIESRIVTNNTVAHALLKDIGLVLQGIRGLKSIKSQLTYDIPVTELVNDPDEIKKFLIDKTQLDASQVDDFLNSSFKSIMFLSELDNTLDIRERLCDPDKIKYLLTLPANSSVTLKNVSNAICNASDESLVLNITLNLMQKMNIGGLVELIFVQQLGLESSNVVQSFDAIQQTFTKISGAAHILRFASNEKGANDTNTLSQGETAALSLAASPESLSSWLCGKEINLTSPDGFDQAGEAIDSLPTSNLTASDTEDPMFESGKCAELKDTILKQQGGAYLWKYLKPLLVGEILYAPANDITSLIVSSANSTFEKMARILSSAESILESNEAVQSEFNGTTNVTEFRELLSKPVAKSLLPPKLTNVGDSLDLFSSDESQEIFSLLSEVIQYSDCISLNRFVGVGSEAELVAVAQERNKNGRFIAGIVFLNTGDSKTKRSVENLSVKIPSHIKYKLRMDVDNVETTLRTRAAYYSQYPRDNLLTDMRYLRGFIQIQEMLDRAIIDLHNGDESIRTMPASLQQMPVPCYNNDEYMGLIYPHVIPVIMALAWMFAVAHGIKTLTAYKESGLDELMKIMGLKSGVAFISWFMNTFIGMVILSILATLFFVFGKVVMATNGFILFLFFITFSLSATTYSYMMSAFFTRANTAAAVGLMVFILSYFPYVIYVQFQASYLRSYLHISSLFSTTAFAVGGVYISRLEQMGEGLQWENINTAPNILATADLSVSWIFFWMLIDSFIYLIIGWYFSNINPGKYGVAKPFYFPFTKSYWSCGGGTRSSVSQKSKANMYKRNPHNNGSISSLSLADQENWHSNPSKPASRVYRKAQWLNDLPTESKAVDLPVGISVEGLSKTYKTRKGEKKAVDNLNMTFSEGHVTAFLGRNGAGKTTTINMLTGLTTPSSGMAYINGYSLRDGVSQIRRELGFCPQFDLLFDFMTVKEHLHLFASMKSNEPRHVIDYDVEDMLQHLGLWKSRHELVGTLSGGMKRRLSVGIAFIGGSRVIVLDEPTSSIDPNGRRVIWDVILKHREGRTIILCTHHLDEADTIGDEVAVLDNGTLRACGSPLELKRKYASGYQMFLEKMPTEPKCDVEEVTTFIKQHCPGALLMTDIGSSLTYTLPSSERSTFEHLFNDMNNQLEKLRLSSYGISDSTLYEVFDKITEGVPDDTSDDFTAATSLKPTRSHTNFGKGAGSGCLDSLSALFRKRALHSSKDIKTLFTVLIVPCLFIALAMGVSYLVPDRANQPSLELQTAMYPDSYSFYNAYQPAPESNELKTTLLQYPGLGTSCLLSDSQYQCSDDSRSFNSSYVSPTSNQSLPDCNCDHHKYTCKGKQPDVTVYNLNTSDFVLDLHYDNLQEYLLKTGHFYKTNRIGGWSVSELGGREEATVWFDNRAYHSSAVYMNALSNMLLRASKLNENSDVSDYGITTYNHPLLLSSGQLSVRNLLEKTADMGISLVMLAAFSFIPAGLCVYLVLEHIREEKHLQYVSGVGPIKYWLITYLWDMLVSILPVLITLLLSYLISETFRHPANLLGLFVILLTYMWAILPFMYMTVKLFKNTTTAFFTLLLSNLFLGIILSLIVFMLNFFRYIPEIKNGYFVTRRIFLIFPQFSFTSAFMQIGINQVLIDVTGRFFDDVASEFHPLTLEHGVLWNIISMVIQGVVFFLITLATEIRTSESMSGKNADKDESDDDVQHEAERVNRLKRNAGSLVVQDLRKQYRLHNMSRLIAVKGLNFGVEQGEVFGLCGVNGAGKTTTFRMLTGQLAQSGGFANLFGRDITSSKSRKLIGYCPQIDALDLLLTARETLSVYAQLKGIEDSEQAISAVIDAFEMNSYANKLVRTYSGGMKRKLCVAIALLGDPQLVFFDEPTAGMDPVARRAVWNQILAAAQRGSAVILTTHSMAEAEALCSRISIMLNGKFACLGTPQHLRSKFGNGYTLKVKVDGPRPHVTRVVNYIQTKYPQAELKDEHLSTVEFAIPGTSKNTLSSVFSQMEAVRNDLYIAEYSVFQTTLDQVFIQFARNQFDQLDNYSSEDTESSSYTDASSRYVSNKGFSPHSDEMRMETEKGAMSSALRTLDAEADWNTKL